MANDRCGKFPGQGWWPGWARSPVVPPALSLILLGCFVVPLAAQQPDTTSLGEIRGQILDAERSTPIGGITVSVPERGIPAVITDAEGRFLIPNLTRGIYNLELRHIAYGIREQLVNVPPGANVSVTLRISTKPIQFDPIEVTVTGWYPFLEQNGYYHRKKLGFGRFFTDEDIMRMGLRNVLSQVPQLRIHQMGSSPFNYQPYFSRGFRACSPPVWVDGMQYQMRGLSLSSFVGEADIGAVEVYRPNSTPAQFRGFDDCGAIVIWTRRVRR